MTSLVFFLATVSTAQYSAVGGQPTYRAGPGVEITGVAGYQWGGSSTADNGEIDVGDTEAYGGILSFMLRPGAYADINYYYQNTSFAARRLSLGEFETNNAEVHYITVGGTATPLSGGRVQPFATGSLGAAILSPDGAPETVNKFAFILGGGLKIKITPRIALRAQIDGRFVFLGGGELFCGIGTGGSSCFASVGDVAVQGNVSGGITFTL